MHLGPNEANAGLIPAGPTKQCSKCSAVKDIRDFYLNARKKDGRQAQCAKCHKKWYTKNSASHKARVRLANKVSTEECKKVVAAYLATHPCVDCGESDPIVLEFDHVRGKKRLEVSKMKYGYPPATLIAEIAKCDVRCANCHRRITYQRRKQIASSFNGRTLDSESSDEGSNPSEVASYVA